MKKEKQGKVSSYEEKLKRKKLLLRIISLLLVICLCIGLLLEYANNGLFDFSHHEHDDTVYLIDNDLIMNGEVLYSNVTINEDRQLILEDGCILMENVTVNSDGTLYGKVNSIHNH